MAKLFKERIVKERVQKYIIQNFNEKLEIVQKWYQLYKTGVLKNKSESEVEQSFNEDILGIVLEYQSITQTIGSYYTRESRPKSPNSGQKADFGLGFFSTDENENSIVKAVIEVKDVNTFLDVPQKREGNLTPIQQGFKYKPFFSKCEFVIVSNFYETRLFLDNYIDYEVWTLDSLIDSKNDYYNLRKFCFLLGRENLLEKSGESLTRKLISQLRIEQENITKKFYGEYKTLRKRLFKDIVEKNTGKGLKLTLEKALEKTQKIIDRIIFIHFCEDSEVQLLPEGKLQENLERAQEFELTPWEVLKLYFKGVDKGSPKLGNMPDGYNGGLFAEDTLINSLTISDDICKEFINLGKYDFQEDLSVTILGHIFEQSISDIEEMKSEIKKEGVGISKRKNDGIFYTPDYIVDYIVRNSLGKYIDYIELELRQKHGLKEDINDVNYNKRAILVYTELIERLKTIKVLDPACGSGAFLVKVFDFLFDKHKSLRDILYALKGTVGIEEGAFDIRSILQNNIYGVDLNQESVEITQLSLWLKTAQKGKQLQNLDKNIKCGNSLIDDSTIAGEKAFNWQKEFSEVFEKGGFDVIVGNPPYGAKLDEESKEYCKIKFENVHTRTIDTFNYFISKSSSILREKGILSFIVPNNLLFQNEYQKARLFLLDHNKTYLVINLGDSIFEDATVPSCIFFTQKERSKVYAINYGDVRFTEQKNNLNTSIEYQNIDIKEIPGNIFGVNKETSKIIDKIAKKSYTIDKIASEVASGVSTGCDKVFRINLNIVKNYGLERDLLKECLVGGDISRYAVNYKGDLLIYSTKNTKTNTLEGTFKYLSQFEDILSQKRETKKGMIPYYSLHWPRYPNLFEEKKIIFRQTGDSITATFDENGFYVLNSILVLKINNEFDIEEKFALAILNSKLTNFVYKNFTQEEGRTFAEVKPVNIRKLFIPKMGIQEQQPFIEKADFMLEKNKFFHEKLKEILSLFQSRYSIEKLSAKLEKFWELEFDELKKALGLKKISIEEERDLLTFFNKEKEVFLSLKKEIDDCDKEIDEMVFDLYGLTKEERKIVLES